MKKIRVLVVDDSAFARKVLREVLQNAGDIEVIDIARDGLEAIEKAHALKPDVMTLDLVMPGADGVAVLSALPSEDAPRVVVVSSSSAETAVGVAALEAGAVELVRKPTALATDRMYELAEELVAAVRVAALARKPAKLRPGPAQPIASRVATRTELVVIGTSTGGPQALTRVLSALPAAFPVPLAIVVHMPTGYTEALAKRLDALSALNVVEAYEGLIMGPGMAVVARAGAHLRIARGAMGITAHLDFLIRPGELHKPSVNALFASAAEALGAGTLGVVLTGMGEDGLAGARVLISAGGRLLAEAESSCVVYGMPRAVTEAGLVEQAAPLERIPELISSLI